LVWHGWLTWVQFKDDNEDSAVISGEEIDLGNEESESEDGSQSDSDPNSSHPSSYLASKQKLIRESVPRGRPSLPLPPGFNGEDEPDAEDDVTDTEESDQRTDEDSEEEEFEGSQEEEGESESDEDWSPSPSQQGRRGKASIKLTSKVSKLKDDMGNLSLSSEADDSLDFLSPQKNKRWASSVQFRDDLTFCGSQVWEDDG
jgi:hypothetical protein